MGYGGVILDVDQEMTDGFNSITIDDGVDDVVITKIELADSDPGIEIVGTLLGLQTGYMEQLEYRFPPTEKKLGALSPAIGQVLDAPRTVKASGGAQKGKIVPQFYTLYIGMKVTGPGKFLRKGFTVTYTSGGKEYTRTSGAQVTICTPDAVDADGTCPYIEPED